MIIIMEKNYSHTHIIKPFIQLNKVLKRLLHRNFFSPILRMLYLKYKRQFSKSYALTIFVFLLY